MGIVRAGYFKSAGALTIETAHYDGTECDGYCLMEDIKDELQLED